MPNYVIDPQVFYWMNVFGILQTVLAVFGGACVIAFFGLASGWVYNSCEVKKGYDSNLFYLKACKRCGRLMTTATGAYANYCSNCGAKMTGGEAG